MEKDKYLTNAPKEEKITIQNDGSYPNLKNFAGDSVDEHKNQEVANSLMAEKEIGQQRENS
ncbi:hypothetical protein JOC75_000170 [Metabacillus crassostreae]|uniref:hypothetical protein n=1 Tax=Metabacillus crassostreae TaxID=929098 RepID=UPI0019575005|nr:hypothetical protein [Metabacillus crassostreae]MBM7602200.1 hypothetical protein [Metabacillus crassostreae]